MRPIARLAVIAAGAASLIAGGLIASGAAGASVAVPQPAHGCGTGVWTGYDNTQADGNNLAISVLNGKVVALAHQTRGFFGVGGSNECFFWFQVAGTTDNAKYAVLSSAQTGTPEGEALTAMWGGPGHPWVLGLASTEKGASTQQLVWDGSADFAIPGAGGDVLQSNGNGKAITLVPAAQSGLTPATTFHYVGE